MIAMSGRGEHARKAPAEHEVQETPHKPGRCRGHRAAAGLAGARPAHRTRGVNSPGRPARDNAATLTIQVCQAQDPGTTWQVT